MTEIVKKIVDSDAMRFVGLAGPGTGKSHTFRTIADSKEFKDRKILVLSFINKLVNDLAADFGGYKNVEVSTLHSFALSEYQRIVLGGEVILIDDLDDVITEDYNLMNDKKIKYSQKICELKLDNDEEKFYKERSEYYQYKGKIYSFNSILYAVNRIYEQETKHICSKYDLILVDEFQDFNQLEFKFIEYLNAKSKVMLVGDDDQSLYDWKFAQPSLIRTLYRSEDSVPFSLDYCYRCPEVIVKAVNSLISNVKNNGYLNERVDDKKYLFPHKPEDEKYTISKNYPQIYYVKKQNGAQLIYQLSKRIKDDSEGDDDARVLVIAPSYLKSTIYNGLRSKDFNIVDFELFADEKLNEIKHKHIFEVFETLVHRKTDSLMLRKSLPFYHNESEIKEILQNSAEGNKKIWNILSDDTKARIEKDITIYKKAKSGKDHLTNDEIVRFSQLFNLKNLISKMISGFDITKSGAQEVDLTTVMSSKGLSADFVYYIGIDDRIMTDKKTGELTDQKICEFLVGITRTKKKLTLFSLYDENPKILDMLDSKLIKKIEIKKRLS